MVLQSIQSDVERMRSEQNVLQESMQKSSDESSERVTELELRIEELDKQRAVSVANATRILLSLFVRHC